MVVINFLCRTIVNLFLLAVICLIVGFALLAVDSIINLML